MILSRAVPVGFSVQVQGFIFLGDFLNAAQSDASKNGVETVNSQTTVSMTRISREMKSWTSESTCC